MMNKLALLVFDHFQIALPHQLIRHIEPWSDSFIDTDNQSLHKGNYIIQTSQNTLPVISLGASLQPDQHVSDSARIIVFLHDVTVGLACISAQSISFEQATPLPWMMKKQGNCIESLAIAQNKLMLILNDEMFKDQLEEFYLKLCQIKNESNLIQSGEKHRCNDLPGI